MLFVLANKISITCQNIHVYKCKILFSSKCIKNLTKIVVYPWSQKFTDRNKK